MRTAEKEVEKLKHGSQQRRKREMGTTKQRDRMDRDRGNRKKEKLVLKPSMEDRRRMDGKKQTRRKSWRMSWRDRWTI